MRGLLNRQLGIRAVSSAVLAGVLALVLWAGLAAVAAAALLASALAGYEVARMAKVRGYEMLPFLLAPVLLTAAVAVVVLVSRSDSGLSTLWAFVLSIGLAVAVLALLAWAQARHGRRGRLFLSAAIYFGVAIAHLPILFEQASGVWWLVLTFATVAAGDIGAYLGGRLVGRHKLAPRISPGKTWEGLAIGLLSGALAAFGLAYLLPLDFPRLLALPLGAAIGAVGAAGDLLESWLKRVAGVKDSGAIFPGHGGLLDRLDSLAPSVILVYWVAQWQ